MRQFKDVIKKENSYRIINSWTRNYLETLDAKEAEVKYGGCFYQGEKTTGFNGQGGHEITVWLDCWN